MTPRSRPPAASLAAALILAGAALGADPGPALDFHRVHVPPGRVGEVPLGPERYLPMPLEEFETAVARARVGRTDAAVAPAACASAARYVAAIDDLGRLVGSLTCDVAAGGPGSLPLGGLDVRRAGFDGAGGARSAVVFGMPSGGLALRTPEPGAYVCDFRCEPLGGPGGGYRLPLVPALETTIDLELAADMRPALRGDGARDAVVERAPDGRWRIRTGTARELGITVGPRDPPQPRIALWSVVAIRGGGAEFAVTCVPAQGWRAGPVTLEKVPGARVVGATAEDGATGDPLALTAADDGGVTVLVPARLEASRAPIVLRGAVPAAGKTWTLPFVRQRAGAWGGGGSVVTVDPCLAVAAIDPESCRVIGPESAARWPVPRDAPSRARPADGPVFHLEFQDRAARCSLTTMPHAPTFDVARVTTVEITPSTVLGRVACDVRVVHGQAFEITARLAPGWIVDSVDQVDASDVESTGDFAPPAERACDWRVDRGDAGEVLRIGLPVAAAPERGVGLRVNGHRRGLPAGSAFVTSDIDMLRFEGEGAGNAVIDFKFGSETFVEIEDEPLGWLPVQGRLAALVEEGTLRGRIATGARVPARPARVVRRRPPLDADVQVRLEPREGVVRQTFSFACRAEAGGVEAVAIDFAEPLGQGVDWSVVTPAGTGCVAQRIGATESRGRGDGVAESWLVELTPPAETAVTIRAVRSVPAATEAPFPLAWVEGATAPGGTVLVGDFGAVRPRIRNRGLRELAAAAAPGEAGGRIAEFAYGPPRADVGADMLPPEPADDARAWAWRETVSCRCHESGAVERETRFQIDNHGRESLALTVPTGERLEEIVLDGGVIGGGDAVPGGGAVRIALPAERRRLELVVRTIATCDARAGAWRVDASGCGIDAPVMERDVRAILPPELELVRWGAGSRAAAGWSGRLFGLPPNAAAEPGFLGFRTERCGVIGDAKDGGLLVVNRRLIASASIVAAVLAAALAFAWSLARPSAAVLLAVVAAVLALWIVEPFDQVARAAWLAAAAGLLARRIGPVVRVVLRSRAAIRGGLGAAGCLAAVSLGTAPRSVAAADPLRVFIVAGDEDRTALVPEPLFRELAETQASGAAAIRVLESVVTAPDPRGDAAWRLELELDADAGGTLVLPQAPGGRWLPEPRSAATGLVVRVEPGGGERVGLTARVAGRHRIELRFVPAVVRRGEVEITAVPLPCAPQATLVAAARGPAAVECDRIDALGVPRRAAQVGSGDGRVRFDVGCSTAARLARPVDPRAVFATGVRVARSVNEITWGPDDCVIAANYEIDPGPAILRSFVVRLDGRCGPPEVMPGGAGVRLEPLGAGGVLVEPAEPARGPVRVRLSARMPLADAVGVFDLPGAWLAEVPDELRTVRLAAPPELAAEADAPLPEGVSAAELAGRPAPVVTVRRRRQESRGVQNLSVSFAEDRTGLELRAQVDSGSLALSRVFVDVPVGCVVDRVTLASDDLDASAARRPGAVDIDWSRAADGRLVAVVQQPRAGRFRLDVDATLPQPPARSGSVPLMRVELGGGAPLLVNCRCEAGLQVVVRPAGAEEPTSGEHVEVPDGASPPEYELVAIERSAGVAAATVASPVTTGSGRVHHTEVFLALEDRGRLRGAARFDLSAGTPVVRLRLPKGLRLYDVLVDGVETAAEPHGTDAWEVRLHDARWPRSILALFAADLGDRLTDAAPLRLSAPAIEGVSGSEAIWLVRPPRGSVVRFAEPARPLDAERLATIRSTAREAIADAFAPAVSGASGAERERLAALAELRSVGGSTPGEAEWTAGLGWTTRDAALGATDASDALAVTCSGPLTLRVTAVPDPTAPSRAAATTALVTLGGIAWSLAARRRPVR